MGKRQPITAETFAEYKKLRGHKWIWLEKTSMSESGTARAFCQCSNCQNTYWVTWQSIRIGKSTQCKKCNRLLPNFDVIQKKITDRGGSWVMQRLWRRHKQTNRREVYCKCSKCGRGRWITWMALQTGKAYNCRVCSLTQFGAFLKGAPPWKKNLWQVWKGFESKHSKKSKCTKSWENFDEFKHWAMKSGFKLGSRLYTKKRNITHYSPETCQWVSINKSRVRALRNRVNIKGY